MGQQVMDGNWLPRYGTIGNVGADMILHMQLASLLQDQKCHSRKLLGERTNVKLGVRRVGYMIIPICHTIALAEKRSVILRDQNRTTEALTSGLDREIFIHLRGNHWLLQ